MSAGLRREDRCVKHRHKQLGGSGSVFCSVAADIRPSGVEQRPQRHGKGELQHRLDRHAGPL